MATISTQWLTNTVKLIHMPVGITCISQYRFHPTADLICLGQRNLFNCWIVKPLQPNVINHPYEWLVWERLANQNTTIFRSNTNRNVYAKCYLSLSVCQHMFRTEDIFLLVFLHFWSLLSVNTNKLATFSLKSSIDNDEK